MSKQIEEEIKSLASAEDVVGVVVTDQDGVLITSTLGNDISLLYAAQVTRLLETSRSVIKELDSNDLKRVKLKTKKHEFVVSVGTLCAVIVIRNRIEF